MSGGQSPGITTESALVVEQFPMIGGAIRLPQMGRAITADRQETFGETPGISAALRMIQPLT